MHRLWQTVQAMLALTFGDEVEQREAIDGILAIHRRVHGTLRETVGRFPAGTRYSAEDPDLVLWVHVTLLESMVLAHDALLSPLRGDERDAYCAESAWVPVALGARPEDVPTTWAAAQAYLQRVYASGTLAVGQDGRAVGQARCCRRRSVRWRCRSRRSCGSSRARGCRSEIRRLVWIVVERGRRAAAAARPEGAARGAPGAPARAAHGRKPRT